MPGKAHTPEHIIHKLREAEVELGRERVSERRACLRSAPGSQ